MIHAVQKTFSKIYSIELDKALYEKAKKRFSKDYHHHIKLFCGDSRSVLPHILSKIEQSCVFWLDAHYSGKETGGSSLKTPIIEELNQIFNYNNFDHVILIDDAHNFTGKNNYPSLEELKEFVSKQEGYWNIIIKEDLVRIHKKISSRFKILKNLLFI